MEEVPDSGEGLPSPPGEVHVVVIVLAVMAPHGNVTRVSALH